MENRPLHENFQLSDNKLSRYKRLKGPTSLDYLI